MSVDHYENFPVASLALPARLRPAVVAIYRFARSADDIADEGDASPQQRSEGLDALHDELDRIFAGRQTLTLVGRDLARAVERHRLPPKPFYDLLDAFRQDVTQTRYADYAQLLDYCRRSANPVGRLLLYLYDAAGSNNLSHSDAICTALQLVNFWQDVAVDWRKGRVYLPQDELARFGVAEAQIGKAICDANWCALMRFQIHRTRALMLSGAALGRALPGRIGFEVRLTIAGGLRILEKIENANSDVFRRRPKLSRRDWPLLLWRALRP